MRTHTRAKRPWLVAAATLAAIAIIIGAAHQGNATAQSGPPDAPANPLAHLIVPDDEDPRVRVSWDASDGATSYTVSRGDGQTFSAGQNATTYSDHTVQPGTAYSYSVAAENGQGSSPSSESASASVPDAPSQPDSLTAQVADIAATDTAASVSLTWSASTVPDVAACEISYPLDGYTIVRSDGATESEIATPGAGATSFTDDTAAFGAAYTYRVMARNAIGNSAASETTVNVPVRPVPPASGLTASITDPFDGTVSLSWEAPSEGPAILGYLVFRYHGTPDPETTEELPTTISPFTVATNAADSSAQAGITYSYIVLAQIADNISNPSNVAVIEPPAPPTDVTAAAGDEAIEVSWTAAAGTVVGYRVERQQDAGWTTVADTTETSHSDSAAAENVAYRYRVQHRNQYGGSAWAESGTATIIALPGFPTDVTVTSDGDDNVLSWQAPADSIVDGYRVRHRLGDGDWTTLADDLSDDDRSYTHEDAQSDVTHQYAVQAHNATGDGPWSPAVSTSRITPPLTPQSVSASIEDDDIVLSWTKPNSAHLDGYTVRHGTGDPEEFTHSGRLAADALSYTIPDVPGDTTYHLSVRAHNSGGDSPWSAEVSIERVLQPSVPTSVSASADDEDITLTWSPPDTGRVAGYHVSYGETAEETRTTVSLDADQTSFVHSDPTEGVAYSYQVRAHNSAGNGPWSEPVQATRLLSPAAPTNVTAAASAGSIDVNWQAPEGSIVAIYEIEYGLSSNTERTVASVTGEHPYFTHTGSQGDVEYQYRVRAVNAAGSSAWTDAVTATRVLAPGKPTDVAAAISGTNIKVTWSAPESVFIDGYHVELRQQNLEEWTRHTVTGATSFTHESPDAGTLYEYRVRTYNAGGVSNWSSKATAIWYQGAAPPTSVAAQPWNNNTQLLVRWTPSETSGVSGYEVRHRVDGGEWSSETTASSLIFHDWDPDREELREYSVRSQKDDTYGDWSAISNFTIARPDAVTNVVTNLEGTNGVRLHWDEPASGQPVQYFIEYNTGDGNWARSGISAGYKRTHRFSSQPYGSTYSFRVMAVNDVYITGPAGQVSVTMAAEPRQFSNIPNTLKIKMLDRDRVRLTWKAPTDYPTEVRAYRVYRKDVTDPQTLIRFGWEETLVRHTGSTATKYVDLTTQPGRLYAYAVAAYRSDEDNTLSAASNPAYARPW